MDGRLIQQAIADKSLDVYATSYAQVSAIFKAEFGRDWIPQLALAQTGADSRSDKEYKLAARNIRSYEAFTSGHGSRQRNPENVKASDKRLSFEEIGKSLAPIGKTPPAEGVKLTITGKVSGESQTTDGHGHKRGSRGERTRSFTVTLTHQQAIKQSITPDYKELFDEWWDGAWEEYGDDGDYVMAVVSVY